MNLSDKESKRFDQTHSSCISLTNVYGKITMHFLKLVALALAGFWASAIAAPTADASAEEPGPGYGLKRGAEAAAEEPGPGYGL